MPLYKTKNIIRQIKGTLEPDIITSMLEHINNHSVGFLKRSILKPIAKSPRDAKEELL